MAISIYSYHGYHGCHSNSPSDANLAIVDSAVQEKKHPHDFGWSAPSHSWGWGVPFWWELKVRRFAKHGYLLSSNVVAGTSPKEKIEVFSWENHRSEWYSNMSMVPSPFSIGKRGCSIPRLEQTMEVTLELQPMKIVRWPTRLYGGFPSHGVPPNHPVVMDDHDLVLKPMVLTYHHFRNPPNEMVILMTYLPLINGWFLFVTNEKWRCSTMLDPSAGIQWDFNMVNLRTTNGGIMKSAVKLKKMGCFFRRAVWNVQATQRNPWLKSIGL